MWVDVMGTCISKASHAHRCSSVRLCAFCGSGSIANFLLTSRYDLITTVYIEILAGIVFHSCNFRKYVAYLILTPVTEKFFFCNLIFANAD